MTEFYEMGEHGRVLHVRSLKQSAIAACPHYIIAAEHYREDESCRCDDPEHLEMKGWGYSWDALKGRWI